MRPFLVTLTLCVQAAVTSAADVPRFFQPPRRPAVPAVKHTDWPLNALDTLVLARLEAKALVPSRPADRARLLRRVTFDLIGLPPTAAEQDAFLADGSPDAYGKVVTRLLASPRFGERQAQHWLDLVRYADSDGFKEDAIRLDAHRYRDWVIRAANAKMPYDQFIQMQLAGDELAPGDPDAPLGIDPAAGALLGAWYGFAFEVLGALRDELAADAPNEVQLWPEHFDAAFDADRAGGRITFGVSPGDATSDEPYLYVLPPGPVARGDVWNAEGFDGAVLRLSGFVEAPDQRAAALSFFRGRREATAP